MSSTSRPPQSPPKRPRLSLQIKALANGPTMRTSRCLAAAVDVKSPTSFNTLSNVYATAVDRSTPIQEKPPMAFVGGRRPTLRLQTQDVEVKKPNTNTPYLGPYLDTPVTAQAISPAVARQVFFPSAMTATPPLSAQPQEQNGAQVFTFDTATPATALPPPGLNASAPAPATQNPRRRTTVPNGTKPPYTHPRSLRSILRNSPLPPLSTLSPESPRRQSLRLQEKALRRVAYNSPLTQEITTSRYIKSHIDLLAEDATPISPSVASSDDGDSFLDQAMTDAASTRDGGQTPGPFEEMRRRMANVHASTPLALSPTGGGIRKRGGKRKEKKRRWVWTIGQDEDAEEGEAADAEPATAKRDGPPSVPVLAVPAPRPRTRNQQALAKAVAAATQAQEQAQTQNQTQTNVPLLAIPVPPARAASKIPTIQPSAPAQAAPQSTPQPQSQPPQQQQQQQQQPQPQQQQQQLEQHTRELTPIPASLLPTRHSTPDSISSASSSCANSVRHLTPEPLGVGIGMNLSLNTAMGMGMGMGMSPPLGGMVVVEPPTPSMESTTSAGSSLHSRDEVDVEMSDASSFTSVEADEGDQEADDEGDERRVAKKRLGLGLGLLYTTNAGGAMGDGDVEMDEGTPTMTARPVGERGGQGWVPWRDAVS